jgi:hypothetical protein
MLFKEIIAFYYEKSTEQTSKLHCVCKTKEFLNITEMLYIVITWI